MFVLKRAKFILTMLKPEPIGRLFQNCNISQFRDILDVKINGHIYKYPFLWLRDNCRCEECFHKSAKSRILNWSDFNLNIKPHDVIKDANSLKVTWEDGHVSQFSLKWLEFRNFSDENKKLYDQTIYRPNKVTWKGDEFQQIFTKHDYNEILRSDEALFIWLNNLSVYGVSLIKNTPNDESAVDDIVAKIGFTKRTHYGVKFVVQHVANTNNVAYLSNNLQMHTDLPYYDYCPGVNLLHCFVQTEGKGGENLLSDAYFVANYMKENNPKEYKYITEIDVEWNDIGTEDGNEFFKLNRSPVVSLNKDGTIKKINFSVPQRGSRFLGSIEDVRPWYEAYSLFFKLNHEFAAEFKTQPGDILVFDNMRLLHGRNAYEDNAYNRRKLIGAYLDWDEIYSRLRCLKVKLKKVEEF